jgi:hypothetical protein
MFVECIRKARHCARCQNFCQGLVLMLNIVETWKPCTASPPSISEFFKIAILFPLVYGKMCWLHQELPLGWGCKSVVGHLPRMCKALGRIPCTEKKKKASLFPNPPVWCVPCMPVWICVYLYVRVWVCLCVCVW